MNESPHSSLVLLCSNEWNARGYILCEAANGVSLSVVEAALCSASDTAQQSEQSVGLAGKGLLSTHFVRLEEVLRTVKTDFADMAEKVVKGPEFPILLFGLIEGFAKR